MAFATDTIRGRAITNSADAGLVAALLHKVQLWRDYTRTRRELSALSNRALADLGLHRSEIAAAAARAVYG